MTRTPLLALAATAAVAAPVAVAVGQPPRNYDARLNAASEVPRTPSKATGSAEFTISRSGSSIAYELRARRLTGRPQAAHIHLGAPGRAGGVMIGIAGQAFSLPREGRLTSANFTPTGNVTTWRQAIAAIRAGRTYINIHTARYPAGEIRGQIRRER